MSDQEAMPLGEAIRDLWQEFRGDQDEARIRDLRGIINSRLVGFPGVYWSSNDGFEDKGTHHVESPISGPGTIRSQLNNIDRRLIIPPNWENNKRRFQLNKGTKQGSALKECLACFPQKTQPPGDEIPYLFFAISGKGEATMNAVYWGATFYKNQGRMSTRLALDHALADEEASRSFLSWIDGQDGDSGVQTVFSPDGGRNHIDIDDATSLREWSLGSSPLVFQVVDRLSWFDNTDDVIRYQIGFFLQRLGKDIIGPAIAHRQLSEKPSVFISYRRADPSYELASRVSVKLKEAGVNCFMDDKSLHGGENWRRTVGERAESSWLVCCLLGDMYLKRFVGRPADELQDLAGGPDWCYVEMMAGKVPGPGGESRLMLVPITEIRLEDYAVPPEVTDVFKDNNLSERRIPQGGDGSREGDLDERACSIVEEILLRLKDRMARADEASKL